jgi:hypothetical protein
MALIVASSGRITIEKIEPRRRRASPNNIESVSPLNSNSAPNKPLP